MKKIFLVLAVASFAFSVNAQDLKPITVMEKVTVGLPGTPTEDNSKGMPVQKVTMDDSTEFYAGVIDFSVFGMDEATLQKMAGTEDFKEQMESGVAMQSGAKLVKNDAGKYADKYTMYDMLVEIDKDGKKGTVMTRTIFYKQYGIAITYKPGIKGENAELKNKVFNSVKIAE